MDKSVLTCVLTLALVCSALGGTSNVILKPEVMTIESGKNGTFTIEPRRELNETAYINLYKDKPEVAGIPEEVMVPPGSVVDVTVSGLDVGLCHILLNTTSPELGNLSSMFVEVTVVHSDALNIVIIIVGWIYFCAWSVSFYPQVILNIRRKSVIGLNFDFLAYNLTGFFAYGVFNVTLFWVEPIMDEYKAKNPYGINPVLLNDVIFTLHAVFITSVTIIQCFIYERGNQRVSNISRVILVCMWLFAIITLVIAAASKGSVISWLDYVYYFSYIKLGVTLIKYIPQAYMNFRRKSTDGWSIGNVLLDCTGGSFSLLQMFLLSYNNDDWDSIFRDPTKFGLGVFSIAFDILFIVQHYVLYRGNDPIHEKGASSSGEGAPLLKEDLQGSGTKSDQRSSVNGTHHH